MLSNIFKLWIILTSDLDAPLLLIVSLIVILLAHIEVKSESLLLGSLMKLLRRTTLLVVAVLTLPLVSIVLKAFCSGLLFSHMDTKPSLFRQEESLS
nr:MAG TPA: hypothetical protein [Microviridae sp.]